jgi:hypothetical protein
MDSSSDAILLAHVANQRREHSIRSLRFALQVFEYRSLAFGRDDVNRDGMLLTEPPASPHRLVILLKTV